MDDYPSRIELSLRLSARDVRHWAALHFEEAKKDIDAALDNYDKDALQELIQQEVSKAVEAEVKRIVTQKVTRHIAGAATALVPGSVDEVIEE